MVKLTNKPSLEVKGNTVGPWKLGETLGLGSTGKVQLAYNSSTGQQAAIKVISKAVFNNDNANASDSALLTPDSLPYGIEREIIIMKLLNHPNVLRLYDVWETDSNLYMVLEYAEKGELFNLLVERGPLPENEAIRFFRQIIIGISYCHALGIVHRDLKPENLLLDHKYNIKIADFGMAALETEDKLLETSCGSPHYAAPEIISGLPYHGLETDVWSCGIILFALLTGRLPFDEEDGNIRNLLLKVQSGQFEMPGNDEISREAQDLISKILTVDPKKRIKTREILKHPLVQKYPSIKDSKTIRNLPREDTYLNPLSDDNGDVCEIDPKILQNLVVLWHGRDSKEITKKLKEPGANAEKTLYALLDRFKNDTEKEIKRQSQLKKRQSQVQQTHSHSNSNTSAYSHVSRGALVNTPTKRKNRASMVSVSSAHKRPVSFNRLSRADLSNHVINTGINGTPQRHSQIESSGTLQRNSSSKRMSINLSSNKRISQLLANDLNTSPTPSNCTKRMSIINGTPPVPMDIMKNYNDANMATTVSSSTTVTTSNPISTLNNMPHTRYTNDTNTNLTDINNNKRNSVINTKYTNPANSTQISTNGQTSDSAAQNVNRASRSQKRKSVRPNMQRGSITTKLISTYAQLAEDDDWEFIEKETKRVSSNFATLIDNIFEHEKYEQIRKEKDELERKVRENKKREEEERLVREAIEKEKQIELEKERLQLQKEMEGDIDNAKETVQTTEGKREAHNDKIKTETDDEERDIIVDIQPRSVSAPLEKTEKSRDSPFDYSKQRNFSLRTRPVSRLDPGLMYSSGTGSSAYNPSHSTEDLHSTSSLNRIDTQKVILETIRRSKFLGSSFDLKKELEMVEELESNRIKQQAFQDSHLEEMNDVTEDLSQHNVDTSNDRIVSTTNDRYETEILPKSHAGKTQTIGLNDSSVQPRTLSEIKVPQFTRKSKFFSESNKRLSVLSLYSSRESFTNLVDMLKEDGINVEPTERSPTTKSQEPEFLFESPSVDTYSRDSSTEDKPINEKENSEPIQSNNLRLSFHDRFNRQLSTEDTEKTKNSPSGHIKDEPKKDDDNGVDLSTPKAKDESNLVKLPALPPLTTKKTDGLGIYQKSKQRTSSNASNPITPSSTNAQLTSAAVNVTPPTTTMINESIQKLQESREKVNNSSKLIPPKNSEIISQQNESVQIRDDYKTKPERSNKADQSERAPPAETTLNDVMTKRNQSKSRDNPQPSEEGKKGVNSFFRKFSKGSSRQSSNSSNKNKSLADDKNIPSVPKPVAHPASPVSTSNDYDFQLKANVAAPQMFKGLDTLFRGWSKYGLKNIKSSPESLRFTGKVSSENILSFKSTVFELEIISNSVKTCLLRFKKTSGSSKSVRRLVNEVENVLRKEGVLLK
ncbi:hypothetical protein TBLA_0A07150 [Henningerozyma blattae CBS 6284]|uniref:non-specific serine/threonine protein kinase n=1 Tax=Henningerozyma blattae (strain ATCC 34711 / CBS 6284 / DSM 70876 / NBRC 10599 / NRRL Y-10934 / UCD 77-7) TaxID=1071380 RepID=I2GWK3_HENB6|nr:hypothetical protein TBLA_0A07150 [Tetrapisispora blattae CBS 6284]CCH58505.1 hypothetical protein TBLA_0A07150 [Tetrapisispora blattae CBS 6284]